MYNSRTKEKFIEALLEQPFKKYACKKVGIDRSTLYRWMKEDIKFAEDVEKYLSLGRENLVDDAEVMLLKKIRVDGYFPAIKFFIQHNYKQYYPRKPMDVYPLDKDQYQLSMEEMIGIELITDQMMKIRQRFEGEDEKI